ncbi:hypothetical protein MHBO_001730 [Bonamia ostreae]|uniref:Ribosomal protein L29 n=1 Tax=Bonamia ostreae TaxID=126728 RepID=A0ABV2AJY8_9EUKA
MAAIKPIEMAEKFNLDPTQIKILKEKVCCARLKLENDSKKEFNRKITKICINAKKIISLRRSVKRVVNWIDHKTNESNFINSKKTENNYKNLAINAKRTNQILLSLSALKSIPIQNIVTKNFAKNVYGRNTKYYFL